MQTAPKVSIVIPVYNGSNYMREAIDSALAQTYKNIEVIVVNDGSNDGGKTREMALSYGDRIRYFEKENGWVSTALNLGIQEMRGEYFSWLSHDDVYYPDKVQAEIEYIQAIGRPDIIVYSDWDHIDSKSQYINTQKAVYCNPATFRLTFICTGVISGCTLLIPRECFERFGTFDPALRYTQDYDLWFRFTSGCEFHHINRSLVKSRLHSAQVSARTNIANFKACINLYLGFIKKISFEEIRTACPQSPSAYAVHFSRRMIDNTYYRVACFALCRAIIFFIRCPRCDVFPEIAKLLSVLKSIVSLAVERYLREHGFRPFFWFRTIKSYISVKRK